MKILYIANIRFPTEKAHGVQIAKTCEALIQKGHEVELWVPQRHTPITEDPRVYYKLSKAPRVRRFFTLDLARWGRVGFLIQALTFACAVASTARRSGAVVYCRDEAVVAVLYMVGVRRLVWESHDGRWNLLARTAAKARAVVVVSQGLKNFYTERGVSDQKLHLVRNGFDLSAFDQPESKEVARKRLGLPLDKKVVLYIGALDGWKGADVLLEASTLLPEGVCLAIVGGQAGQVSALAARFPQVLFLGQRPYGELADNQSAADVLVLPNTGKDRISVHFTSPLKLFGYMASGVPIVASDLPSVRELVDESCAYFVPPDDAPALAQTVVHALEDPGALLRAKAAQERVRVFSWEHRAKKLQALLETI